MVCDARPGGRSVVLVCWCGRILSDGGRVMELAYADRTELEVGRASNPVVVNDLRPGDGVMIPEINYTPPPMTIESHNRAEVQGQFREIVDAVLDRAERLRPPGLVLQFEHLPALTEHVEIGVAVTE